MGRLFKRIRQLRISLAAKCQILFGTAVVLIIAAALFVPWQRMEDLTAQLDHSAAGALADQAVERHIWKHETGPSDPNAARVNGTTRPTTAPTPPRSPCPNDASHARLRPAPPQPPRDTPPPPRPPPRPRGGAGGPGDRRGARRARRPAGAADRRAGQGDSARGPAQAPGVQR